MLASLLTDHEHLSTQQSI